MLWFTALLTLAVAAGVYVMGRRKAVSLAGGVPASLHSRPSYHGLYCALWTAIAGLGTLLVAALVSRSLVDAALLSIIDERAPDLREIERQLALRDAYAIARGGIASTDDALRQALGEAASRYGTIRLVVTIVLGLGAAALAAALTFGRLAPDWRARNRAESVIQGILWVSATIAILTTVGIVLSLIGETLVFFNRIDWQIHKYVFGTTWSPLSGVFEGSMDADKVGAVPLFLGTFMITIIAMLVAVPIGLFAAIYLSDFAPKSVRSWAKPLLEILAGIPTVVYGFFAAITVAPFIRDTGEAIGLDVASESALAAGVVMGIMIIPFISSLSDDVINAVPQSLRDGSYACGATKAETMRQVVLPAALPGIVSAVLLGVSRAVGETMIVVMAAGQGANLTVNPLEAVTTVTVQIVALITGDTEADTAAGPAFTLGFTLFVVTLALNVLALRIVRKYREIYD
jgi:phosphate transport system permease protein